MTLVASIRMTAALRSSDLVRFGRISFVALPAPLSPELRPEFLRALGWVPAHDPACAAANVRRLKRIEHDLEAAGT